MDKVRFGIVGCGNMGTSHTKNFVGDNIPHGIVTAACDINPKKLAMYKEIYRRYVQRVKDCSKRYKYIVLEQIIEEPAPSFYLDEQSFRGIVYRTLRERQ